MSRTLEQKIADAEARLQRLKAKSRSLDTAQKVVVGSAHITYRKTVRMCSTWRRIHFRFLAHSLANARSLGLRRADD
ncbi:hypothetical protein ACSLOD_27960, partial [Escherichia coli]